jgi:hypothetical protein
LRDAVTLRIVQAASSSTAATTALTNSNSALTISSRPSVSKIQTSSRITAKIVVSHSNITLSPGGLVARPSGEVQALIAASRPAAAAASTRSMKNGSSSLNGGLDDAPAVLGNLRVHQFATAGLQACESAFLISSQESAIASHIGGQDGGELAFDPLGRHRGAPS